MNKYGHSFIHSFIRFIYLSLSGPSFIYLSIYPLIYSCNLLFIYSFMHICILVSMLCSVLVDCGSGKDADVI